jgi:hypothetical protein
VTNREAAAPTAPMMEKDTRWTATMSRADSREAKWKGKPPPSSCVACRAHARARHVFRMALAPLLDVRLRARHQCQRALTFKQFRLIPFSTP